ncbi:MAG: hypothetical protein ABI395_02630 [Sphingobium sp.]
MPITETSPIDPVTATRPTDAIAPVRAIALLDARTSADQRGASSNRQSNLDKRERSAGAAEYARINARIADIFADLNATAAPVSHAEAEHRVLALMPDPVVIIPLPPASADMVERAVRLAQDMAEQAAIARAAQSNVNGGIVDEVLTARV